MTDTPSRTLHLLRHGEAAHATEQVKDYDRPLTDTGQQQAYAMAGNIRKLTSGIDVAYVSTAVRTRETAQQLLQGECVKPQNVTYDDMLYLASTGDLLYKINHFSDAHHTILMVGHNPGLQELASLLSANHASLSLPPCGLVTLQFCVNGWQGVVPGSGQWL